MRGGNDNRRRNKKTSKEPVEIKPDPELKEYFNNKEELEGRAGRRLKKKAYMDTERK